LVETGSDRADASKAIRAEKHHIEVAGSVEAQTTRICQCGGVGDAAEGEAQLGEKAICGVDRPGRDARLVIRKLPGKGVSSLRPIGDGGGERIGDAGGTGVPRSDERGRPGSEQHAEAEAQAASVSHHYHPSRFPYFNTSAKVGPIVNNAARPWLRASGAAAPRLRCATRFGGTPGRIACACPVGAVRMPEPQGRTTAQ